MTNDYDNKRHTATVNNYAISQSMYKEAKLNQFVVFDKIFKRTIIVVITSMYM
jgi:hypothetical protein